MQIAVTTPTGNVGRHVVATLVRAGVRPRVLLREPDRLAPGVRDEVDAVPVDQYDADAVVAATDGVDALFWVDPTTGSEDPLAGYARATGSVVRAATGRRIGVERITDDAMRAQLRQAGMTDGWVEAVLGMSTCLRENFVPEQRRTVRTTTPTTLAAWAYDHLRHRIVDAS